MLDQVVDEVLEEYPEHHSSRNILIAHTVKALERDSDWVEPYVVTSELRVPELSEDSSPKEVISRIREVVVPPHCEKTDSYHPVVASEGQTH